MATSSEWVHALARQADADFKTFDAMQSSKEIDDCHKMLFLQMACEKMCKAHLIQGGTPPLTLQSSHAYVAKQLPLVIRQQVLVAKQDPRKVAWVVQHAPFGQRN